MIDHPLVFPSPVRRSLRALAYLSVLGLGASQANALPPAPPDPAASPALVEGASEPLAAQDQQPPLATLNEVLDATRAKLDELTEAAAKANAQLREEVEALKGNNLRLTEELAEASSRQSELERTGELADARIKELTEAAEAAHGDSARLDESIARLRRQNAQLNQGLARAHAARVAAETKTEKTQAELTKELEGAADAAARSKAELAAAEEQLGQAARAAVEAERARQTFKSEADALRGEAARARQQSTAARAEIDRLKTANTGLEQQITSLYRESRSATETARQNLSVMVDKLAALNAAIDSARDAEGVARPAAETGQAPVENEPASATPATSMPPEPAVPESGRDTEASGPVDGGTNVAVVEPIPATSEPAPGLARFHASIEALNELEMSAAGIGLFSGIAGVNGHAVNVSATPAWDSIPPIGQESYLESLLNYWVAAQGGSGPAVVRIVDPSGQVLIERSTQ